MTRLLSRNATSSFLRRWAPVVVVCIPVAWAAIVAAAGNWVPTGDDAYFTVRSRDVLTSHHPLLGAWSSGSIGLDTQINNLGPIQLDLLAPFTRWTPMGGTAIGTALINIAAIVAIGWLMRRAAGERAVLPAMGAIALLTWTLGSEMLITPRQHQALVLPYLCLLVSSWVAARGDRWAIVIAVAAGSLVAQTHLSYPVLVAALALVIVVGQIVVSRLGEATGGRRPLIVAGVLLTVLWVQTVIDQFAGFGNLGDVLFGSGEAGRAGLAKGWRVVAGVLVSTDAFLRPGYRAHDPVAPVASLWQSVLFGALLTLAVMSAVIVYRRRGWQRVSGLVVAVVAVVAGVVDVAMLPVTQFGLSIMNYRWLWATATFVLMLVLIEVERWSQRRLGSSRGQTAVVAGFAVLCVVSAVATIPRSVQYAKADVYLEEHDDVEDVLRQLDDVWPDIAAGGPLVIDETGMYFGHGYTYPLLVAMQEHGVDFRFDERYQERRFGTGRLSDGSETQRLRLVSGGQALDVVDDPDLVAFVDDPVQPVAILLERR